MKKYHVEIGMVFNRLTVVEAVPRYRAFETFYACKCSCGVDKLIYVRASDLAKGNVKSCGCYSREMAKLNVHKAKANRRQKQHCQHCQSEFMSVSDKQIHCSDDCRFLAYQNASTEENCWNWLGPKVNEYGMLTISGKGKATMLAHRYAYQKYVGELVEGNCIMHTCDNPACTNPKHLQQGTWADNNKDRSLKGRSGKRTYTAEEKARYSEMFRGEANVLSKLTEDQAREIFNDRSLGCVRASKKYGVSTSVIKSIRSGRSWRHLNLKQERQHA